MNIFKKKYTLRKFSEQKDSKGICGQGILYRSGGVTERAAYGCNGNENIAGRR